LPGVLHDFQHLHNHFELQHQYRISPHRRLGASLGRIHPRAGLGRTYFDLCKHFACFYLGRLEAIPYGPFFD